MLDTLITGGAVVDGSGGPAWKADVGIRHGRIEAIGRIEGGARTVIDATGHVVCPGFIDIHTHYDAQLFWDGALTSSPLHGVTTVIAGNCGFSIAPLAHDPEDVDYVLRLLARVEGIPTEALRLGVPWNWSTTAEFLDAADERLAINAGFMIGHSALRRAVMGAEAVRRPSTSGELALMADLLRAGIEAGGLGLSSSWAETHVDAEGEKVPSRHADRDELVALASVVGEFEGTSLEMNPRAGLLEPGWPSELLADLSAAARRPINWNVLIAKSGNRDACLQALDASGAAGERGGRVVALAMPVGVIFRLSLGTGVGFDLLPGWSDVINPPREKLVALQDSGLRQHLRTQAEVPHRFAHLSRWADYVIQHVVAVENEPWRGWTVGDVASEQGRDPYDVFWDVALTDELRTSFAMPDEAETEDAWRLRAEVILDPRAVVGGSDAGAHVDMLDTFNYPTRLLAELVRERSLLPLERAVHLLTERPAQLYGLRERGRLIPGWPADVVVFDPATVASGPVVLRDDLPGGGSRLYADAVGVETVLVRGVPVVDGGRLTDSRPGRVLRAGVATTTPERF